jgi:hypothetical protein
MEILLVINEDIRIHKENTYQIEQLWWSFLYSHICKQNMLSTTCIRAKHTESADLSFKSELNVKNYMNKSSIREFFTLILRDIDLILISNNNSNRSNSPIPWHICNLPNSAEHSKHQSWVQAAIFLWQLFLVLQPNLKKNWSSCIIISNVKNEKKLPTNC